EVLVRERVRRVVAHPGVGEPARVAQRRLLLVVPAGSPAAAELRPGAVRVDHLRGGDHRVGTGLAGHGDAVLHLRAHDPSRRHRTVLVRVTCREYWDRAVAGTPTPRACRTRLPAAAGSRR